MKPSTVKLAEARLYTVKEAAAFFSMSVSWIRDRVAAGDLDGYLCGNLLISGASINRYLASRATACNTTKSPEHGTVPAGATA